MGSPLSLFFNCGYLNNQYIICFFFFFCFLFFVFVFCFCFFFVFVFCFLFFVFENHLASYNEENNITC